MKNVQKPLVFVGQNEDAYFCAVNALEIPLGKVLGAKLGRKREPRQAKTSQDRPRQAKTGRSRQVKTGQDRPRQAKTGQDRTRQDKTDKDRPR
jgi:hypothetical protein